MARRGEEDVDALLSELTRVGVASTPLRAARGAGALPATADDVLSPATRDVLYGLGVGGKTGRGGRTAAAVAAGAAAAGPAAAAALRREEEGAAPRRRAGETPARAVAAPVAAGASDPLAGGIDMGALGVADEGELDSELSRDPSVVCYDDRVVLRSSRGTYLCVARESVAAGEVGVQRASATGNPTDPACELVMVGIGVRARAGVVKHGDTVALASRKSGRFLGVFGPEDDEHGTLFGDDDDDDILVGPLAPQPQQQQLLLQQQQQQQQQQQSVKTAASRGQVEQQWRVACRRKIAGRREHWTVVEIPEQASADRVEERERRGAAAGARLAARARQLGYASERVLSQLAPKDNEVPTVVRTSDCVLLRSVMADSLFLSSIGGRLRLSRVPREGQACQWNIVKSQVPFMPLWARQPRPAPQIALEESGGGGGGGSGGGGSALQGRHELETALVEALLFAMQGIESELVQRSSGAQGQSQHGVWHVVHELARDKSLANLSERFLPLCSHVLAAEAFVARRGRPEFGRVSHALAAAMRALLREYGVLLAQLETQKLQGRLSIQKLWFYVQPSMRSLEVLASVARGVGPATGGALLNELHRLAQSGGGDPRARAVFQFLAQAATVPYLEMLQRWVFLGEISDPYKEFMVCVDEDTSKRTLREDFNARYWDRRYTLRGVAPEAADLPKRSSAPSSSAVAAQAAAAASSSSASSPDVPFFLERIADKILTTGKYLNVVRECGHRGRAGTPGAFPSTPGARPGGDGDGDGDGDDTDAAAQAMDELAGEANVDDGRPRRIPYSEESHAYDVIVSRAHDVASRTLLRLLLGEWQLVARLRSLKHYFLLDQGDFFVHFMDIAHDELQKPAEQIAVSRLQSLLEVCLRGRNNNDPFQEDLVCDLVPYALTQHVEAIHDGAGSLSGRAEAPPPLTPHRHQEQQQHQQQPLPLPPPLQLQLLQLPLAMRFAGLHGVDAFTLDFRVQWPLSLVLSREALTKYQLIFRHLFFCKHVERQLCTTWLAHQTTKALNLRSALGPDYCLRQRMLHFLQNFEYYIMFEVLEPRWHELEQRLRSVKTVDELMKHHSEFLDTSMRECLLTHQGLLKTLAKIMTTCLLFAEQIGRFADQLAVDEASMEIALRKQRSADASNASENTDAHNPARPKPARVGAGSQTAQLAQQVNDRQKLRNSRIKVQEQHVRAIVTQDSYRAMIRRSQTTFDTMLDQFMDELLREATHGEYHSHLSNLCTRLDFNGYHLARKRDSAQQQQQQAQQAEE